MNAPDIAPVPHLVSVRKEEVLIIGQRFIDVINEARGDGHSLDSVLTAMAWALGCTMQQRGIVLNPSAPLSAQVPPLCLGYAASLEAQSQ